MGSTRKYRWLIMLPIGAITITACASSHTLPTTSTTSLDSTPLPIESAATGPQAAVGSAQRLFDTLNAGGFVCAGFAAQPERQLGVDDQGRCDAAGEQVQLLVFRDHPGIDRWMNFAKDAGVCDLYPTGGPNFAVGDNWVVSADFNETVTAIGEALRVDTRTIQELCGGG